MQSIDLINNVVKSYDDYFTLLAAGEPEAPKIPELTVGSLAEILNTTFDDSFSGAQINSLMDSAKLGFTIVKFNKAGTPKWWAGYKLTGTKYYPEE